MYIISLCRESVLMGLNRAAGEGNLTASNECPVTYVSLSHTKVDIVINAGERIDSSAPRAGWAYLRFVNGLLLMRPYSVQADTQSCCLVAYPQPTSITKGGVGSLGPWTPKGCATLIMLCNECR